MLAAIDRRQMAVDADAPTAVWTGNSGMSGYEKQDRDYVAAKLIVAEC